MKKDSAVYIKSFQAADRMGTLFGHEIVSLTADECLSRYEVQPQHFNPNGILHGGALFAVMDSAQGAFIHFILDEKFKYAATGTATVRYMAPVKNGTVQIRTWLKEIQNRKIFLNSVATDSTGREVASLEEIWIAVLKE